MANENSTITALIVDDEKLARSNIRLSLQEYKNWEIVGECDRGDEVLNQVKALNPDVVFLDIKMPGLDGLKVCQSLQQLNSPPLIVFATAYDIHAVDAFELCALDYLLKPFDDERFNQTIERIEELHRIHHRQFEQVDQLNQISNPNSCLKNLIVRSVGRIQLIPVESINWISTAGNYVELHQHDKTILHRVSLSYLEKHLPPDEFLRVHRTAMIRVTEVTEFRTLSDGQYSVILSNNEEVGVSQSYREVLMKRLGVD